MSECVESKKRKIIITVLNSAVSCFTLGALHVLGWLKSSFGFVQDIVRKTRMNFLADPILFHLFLTTNYNVDI